MATFLIIVKAAGALAALGFVVLRLNTIRKYGMRGLRRGFVPPEGK